MMMSNQDKNVLNLQFQSLNQNLIVKENIQEGNLNIQDQRIIDQNLSNQKQENCNKNNVDHSSTISQADQNSDNQYQQQRKKQIEAKISQKKDLMYKKVAVGSGFSLDMTDFFKFKKRKKYLKSQDSLFSSITEGYLPWLILFYSICNAAIMPAWIMSIKANKILRISWRFLLQAIFMIPFVLYERRTGNQSIKKKYQWSYIFDIQGLRRVYISSLGTTIWFTIILSCFQWTYISHSLTLGSLSNFFLSLNRLINHTTHQLQPGGQIFVITGIIFIMVDSYTLDVKQLPHSVWSVINILYLKRQPFQRVIADLAALTGALILSRFSQMAVDLKSYYPPFLSMFLVNISISFHVGLSAYFVNGATFDRDTSFGVWGLLTGAHFGAFFYMAIVLSLGMYISFTMISKLFSDPILPALAMTLEPFFATFFLNLVSVQSMPGSYSIYGYIFLICGLFMILIGQYLIQRKKQKQQQQNKIQEQLKQKFMSKVIKQKEQQEQGQKIQSLENIKKNVNLHNYNDHQGHGYSDVIHR